MPRPTSAFHTVARALPALWRRVSLAPTEPVAAPLRRRRGTHPITIPGDTAVSFTSEETSRYVDAAGVRIHYHEAGTGPVLLLVHGGAPGAYGWGNFGQNLEALAQHFRTIIVDLPGYGKSDKPEVEGDRNSFYAETFLAMMDALSIDSAHVCGLATGGGAAITMAVSAPERIERLILVSSMGGLPLFSTRPTEGQKVIQSYYKGDGPSEEKMRNYLSVMMYDQALITDDVVQDRYQASIDPEFMAKAPEGRGQRKPDQGPPLWTLLGQVEAPTLVVWGRDNRIQGYDNALFMLNQIPDVRLHIFGKTGLWVPFERAREFEALVTGFLREDNRMGP
ncbi:alpha/beta fold hydrolase [Salinibacterium sp. dk2585]|nr:alpha/beta fold hydrolase [Salinibacterium sp. dk2585]TXK56073.1 alpha/beta fold hydrolase [Salinibacterium sp. dk5596]